MVRFGNTKISAFFGSGALLFRIFNKKGLARGRRRRFQDYPLAKEAVITVYLFWSIRMDGAQSGGVKPPSGRSVRIEHFRGKMWLFNYDTGIVNALLINRMSAPAPEGVPPRRINTKIFKQIPARRASRRS